MKLADHFVSPAQFKLPHWVMIIVMAFVGAVLSYWNSNPTAILTAITTGAGWIALLKGGLAAGVIMAIGVAMVQVKQAQTPPPAAGFKGPEAPTKRDIPSVPPVGAGRDMSSPIPPLAVHRKTLFFPLIAAAALLAACSSCSSVPAPSPNVIPPTIATAVCILTTVSTDVNAHMPWPSVVADTIAKCGADATTIEQVWGAHVKAEVTEGFIPKPISSDAGKP